MSQRCPATNRFMAENPKDILMRNVKTNEATGCWNWTGRIFKRGTGYGQFKSVMIRATPIAAHRASWIIHNGPIASSKILVRHRCDNSLCCNPDHLELGSYKQNMEDCISRGRISKGCGRHNTKMTPAKVKHLRIMRAEGASLSQIASNFGFSKSTAHRIVTGQSWAHVT